MNLFQFEGSSGHEGLLPKCNREPIMGRIVFVLVVVTLAPGQHAVKRIHLGWAVHFSDVSGLCRNFNSLTNFTGKTPSRLGASTLGVECLHVQLKNRENEPWNVQTGSKIWPVLVTYASRLPLACQGLPLVWNCSNWRITGNSVQSWPCGTILLTWGGGELAKAF